MTDNVYLDPVSYRHQPNTFMRTQILKRLSVLCCLGAAALGLSERAAAQLSVGPSGLAAQPFNSQPAATEWSTRTNGPSLPSTFTNATGLDAAVQTNAA